MEPCNIKNVKTIDLSSPLLSIKRKNKVTTYITKKKIVKKKKDYPKN
jgi:hypothetical protein